jgi:hypothetical protein
MNIESIIKQAIDRHTKEIIEEEAAEAAKRVEKRVREKTGEIAANIARHIEYNQMGQELRITVRFPEIPANPWTH